MTKRLLPLSLALSAVLTFSACGSLTGQKAEPAPTVTVTTDSPESESSKPEASQDASSDATDQTTEDPSDQPTNDTTDQASTEPSDDQSPASDDSASSEPTESSTSSATSGSTSGASGRLGDPSTSATEVDGFGYSFTMPAGWAKMDRPTSMGAEKAFAQAEKGKVARVFGIARHAGGQLTAKEAADLVAAAFRKQGGTAVFVGAPKQLDGMTVYPVNAKKTFNGVPTQVQELVGIHKKQAVEVMMISSTATHSNAVEEEFQQILNSWKWDR